MDTAARRRGLTIKATRITLLIFFVGSILPGRERLPTVAAAGIPDPRFGVVQAYEAPAAGSALGAGWSRVTFEWNRIQPNNADEWYSLPTSEEDVNSEIALGRQLVGLLNTTPGWATDFDIGPGVPRGLYLPLDDPGNLWANFVRTIVGRYVGRIDHWTIWNEPDIPRGSGDMSWGGSVDDYVRLLQVGYAVAKETNPNAVVHMAGIMHWYDEHWFGHFIDAVTAQPGAAANGYWFDIATLHLYHEPEKIHDITAHYVQMMRGRGIHKPLWIAETNAYLSRATPEEQAFFMFQAISLEIAAGAERIAVYKMVDTETDSAADPEPFGLVQSDGSRRPAFTAYQVATTYLAGFRGGSWDRRDDISVVTIDRGARTTTVAWSRIPEPRTAMLPARTTRALLVDVWGAAHYVYPERGYYFVDLPAAWCTHGCAIGGAPSMLVEEAPASANTAPAPRSPTPVPAEPTIWETPTGTDATQTTTPAPPATHTATATSTATVTPTYRPTATSTATPTPTYRPPATSTATPTATPTVTTAPTWTSMPSPTATWTATPMERAAPTQPLTPSSTTIPMPASDIPSGQPWLVVGVLALALAGGAFAAEAGGRRTLKRGFLPRRSSQVGRLGYPIGRPGFAVTCVRGLVILMILTAAILIISKVVQP